MLLAWMENPEVQSKQSAKQKPQEVACFATRGKKGGIQGWEDGTQEKADIKLDSRDINEIRVKYCR